MGPPHVRGGDVPVAVTEPMVEPVLQWGRRMFAAETMIAQRQDYFRHDGLQWGRRMFAAETEDTGGGTYEVVLLQWGRRMFAAETTRNSYASSSCRSRFNGAAACSRRRQ